ncbi:MAG TPA: protein phosphatase 2C domain-containing protein [Polyangiaceae bacterium]|nr:protein phosphatase 2C domain-containing protein [Polyangiaceae bacterium]
MSSDPQQPAPILIPLATASEVTVDAAGLTDVGVERDRNEDAYLVGTLHRSLVVHEASIPAQGWFGSGPAGTLLVVADGMGGQGGGDIASRTAITAVSSYLVSALPWAPNPREVRENRDSLMNVRGRLFSALVAGDATVKMAGAKSHTPHMGTTLTAALVLWPVVYVAHVGDSRCYLYRAGKLQRLTTDHNLAEALGAKQDSAHAESLQNILWNTLGATEEVPRPELSKLELALGDTLLLCSDGLNKHVPDEQMQAVLQSSANSRECCARLVELALQGGGTDNVTVVVARLNQPSH